MNWHAAQCQRTWWPPRCVRAPPRSVRAVTAGGLPTQVLLPDSHGGEPAEDPRAARLYHLKHLLLPGPPG